VWSAWLIRFVVPVLIVTVIGHRLNLIDTPSGLVLLTACWIGASLSLLLGLAALRTIWRLGLSGTRRALTGVLLSLPILAAPVYYIPFLVQYPRLNDITTDTVDPPAFEAAAALRPASANPVAYPGPSAARMQLAAYPDLQPLRVGVSLAEAYDAADAVVHDQGWRIVGGRPPSEQGGSVRIEAVARTLLMGFKDDVAIRISEEFGGVRVDMRSASRYGSHDLGANARRIQAFIFALREEITPTAGGER
jgi:hypothetical protein